MSPGSHLILGGDGLIGRSLAASLSSRGETVVTTTRDPARIGEGTLYLDLGKEAPFEWPDVSVAYCCIGVPSIAECERDPATTHRINVDRTVGLVEEGLARELFIVCYSSNLVFSGADLGPTEMSERGPTTEHGRQKMELENLLHDLGSDRVLVLRCSKVAESLFGLLKQWVTAAQRGEKVHPFSDKVLAPISVGDLVRTTRLAVNSKLHGLYNLSGYKDVTYADLARYVFGKLGIADRLIQSVRVSDQKDGSAIAPPSTAMNCAHLSQQLGIHPPAIDDALRATLQSVQLSSIANNASCKPTRRVPAAVGAPASGFRTLVVGAAGFVGQNLSRHLEEGGGSPDLSDSSRCDLLDPGSVQSLMDSFGDEAFNLVMCAGIKRTVEDSPDAMRRNVQIASNVGRAIRDRNVRQLIFVSTVDVYGSQVSGPLSEATSPNPTSEYAISMLCSEYILRSAASPAVAVLRLPGIYGQGDQQGSMAGRIVSAIRREGVVYIDGDGSTLRDYVYIPDLCGVIEAILARTFNGVLNVASGTSVSIGDFVATLIDNLGAACEVKLHPSSQRQQHDLSFDTRRLAQVVPEVTFHTINEGLDLYLQSLGGTTELDD